LTLWLCLLTGREKALALQLRAKGQEHGLSNPLITGLDYQIGIIGGIKKMLNLG
jgi:hypothetical protein